MTNYGWYPTDLINFASSVCVKLFKVSELKSYFFVITENQANSRSLKVSVFSLRNKALKLCWLIVCKASMHTWRDKLSWRHGFQFHRESHIPTVAQESSISD